MPKYAVMVEARDPGGTDILPWVVHAESAAEAEEKAVQMARVYYQGYDEFEPFGTELLRFEEEALRSDERRKPKSGPGGNDPGRDGAVG